MKNRTMLYVGLMMLAAAAAGYIVARQLQPGMASLRGGTALPQPRELTAFTLTDQQGAAFGNARLRGHPSLMFFGFTHCPDVCPTTLAMMAQLAREPGLSGLHMVFVTVDPGRDDAVALQRYVGAFGNGITGLRGEDAALEPLMRSVGAARVIQPLAGNDYLVDHSATLFYLDGHGRLAAVFTPPFAYPVLRDDLLALVDGAA